MRVAQLLLAALALLAFASTGATVDAAVFTPSDCGNGKVEGVETCDPEENNAESCCHACRLDFSRAECQPRWAG
jgi:hypothetical protein